MHLALRAHGSGNALAAWAMHLQLELRPCSLHFAHAGRALPLQLKALPWWLALHTPGLGLALKAQASPLQLKASPTHNNQTAKHWPQKLHWQHCRLFAAEAAAGGRSSGSSSGSSIGSCGGIGCGSGSGSRSGGSSRK